jgi:hypothetical protein
MSTLKRCSTKVASHPKPLSCGRVLYSRKRGIILAGIFTSQSSAWTERIYRRNRLYSGAGKIKMSQTFSLCKPLRVSRNNPQTSFNVSR